MTENELTGELERFSYALGMSVASNLINSGVKTINPDVFVKALSDAFNAEMPLLTADEANQILEEFLEKTSSDEAQANLESGQKFLLENVKKDGITELPSGLQFEILKQGDGLLPTLNDEVKCHYHGTLTDGTVFDSSVQRGNPAVFPVNGVIRGWIEALQLMPVGSKWRLFIPPGLAYGKEGAGGIIGPNTTLVFEVELLEII